MATNHLSPEFLEYHEQIMKIPQEVHKWIVGADNFIKLLVICLLSGSRQRYNSHVFAVDQVGVGKTTIMYAFARACGGSYRRIQFTPDKLPMDLVRVVKIKEDGSVEYEMGPLFANFVVADEISRSSEKTRSALLEGMEEGKVTIDNDTFDLPRPFMVLATANPMDVEGVWRLGVAQKDRFMMQIQMEDASEEEALQIIDTHERQEREKIEPVITLDRILGARDFISHNTFLSEDLMRYIVRWVRKTCELYNEQEKTHGASGHRPGTWLARGSRAVAFLDQRDYVTQADIDFLLPLVLQHRMSLGPLAEPGELERTMQQIGEDMHRAQTGR